jgi:hypothetical protein
VPLNPDDLRLWRRPSRLTLGELETEHALA